MSDERAEQQYPAVERLREDLRANLLRAARGHAGSRIRLSRRQRVGVLAAIGVLVVPGGMAVARALDSPEVEYECPSASLPGEVRVGVPVNSFTPVATEPPGPMPENPCE
jgi:hypothetical protein